MLQENAVTNIATNGVPKLQKGDIVILKTRHTHTYVHGQSWQVERHQFGSVRGLTRFGDLSSYFDADGAIVKLGLYEAIYSIDPTQVRVTALWDEIKARGGVDFPTMEALRDFLAGFAVESTPALVS